jgi:hypothetical protein
MLEGCQEKGINLNPKPDRRRIKMLTTEQKETFRKAVDFLNGDKSGTLECPLVDNNDDVVTTSDTVDDFKKHAGLVEKETAFGKLFVAENHQAGKGLRRGDLFVMDFGDARAAYFTGESLN